MENINKKEDIIKYLLNEQIVISKNEIKTIKEENSKLNNLEKEKPKVLIDFSFYKIK